MPTKRPVFWIETSRFTSAAVTDRSKYFEDKWSKIVIEGGLLMLLQLTRAEIQLKKAVGYLSGGYLSRYACRCFVTYFHYN